MECNEYFFYYYYVCISLIKKIVVSLLSKRRFSKYKNFVEKMSRFLKKFTRKKNSSTSSSRGDSSETATEIQHGFVDGVGGINFPTSPNADSLSSRKFSESSELTIFWSQPRDGRNTQRVNPIFINEPTELYEAAFIPPDNAHDFSVLPRYRVNDNSRSMHGLNAIEGEEDVDSSLYRSRSLGAMPAFNYDNEGIKLVDLKNKRRDEQGSRGMVFGLFKEGEDENSFSSEYNRSTERDSGVYPTFDNEDDDNEEPIEQLLARKLAGYQSDESEPGTRANEAISQKTPSDEYLPNEEPLNDVMIDETIRESNLLISALESSCNDSNGNRGSHAQAVNNNYEASPARNSFGYETDIRDQHVTPSGRFIRSKSVPCFNESFGRDYPTHSDADMQEDFDSIERTLNDLEHHLTDVLVERTQRVQSDPKALREKQLFDRRNSPSLGAVRGRVSSVKKYLEDSQGRSKSVSNLSSRNTFDDEDDSDNEMYGAGVTRQTNGMRSAASFGNIDPNSLSPLLNDRKYFGNAVLRKDSRGKSDIRVNGDRTFNTHDTAVGASSDVQSTRRKTTEVKPRTTQEKVVSSTGNNIQIVERNFPVSRRVEDLNMQLPNTHPSAYMHAQGDSNTVTGAGVAILQTQLNRPAVKKKPTVESFLKAVGRTELPEFLEDEVSFLYHI